MLCVVEGESGCLNGIKLSSDWKYVSLRWRKCDCEEAALIETANREDFRIDVDVKIQTAYVILSFFRLTIKDLTLESVR